MTSPGNHEFWFNFTAYKLRFAMPDEGRHDGMYWSIDIANSSVHLAAIDTESPLDLAWIDQRQREWLEADLAVVSARRATEGVGGWTIVGGHRPLYCTNHGGQDVPHGNGVLRAAIEGSLLRHGTDLVLQAHEHGYERSYPTRNGQPSQTNYSMPTAPVYIVNGAGGNREANELPPGDQPWSPAPQEGFTPQTSRISYGRLTIAGQRLRYEQVDSVSGETIDAFTINK
eukprot:CAMPEP_0181218922 /NCGR_PEP_ID=MMETSP1096-20121128/27968_1 /TAXON_ID=156174 ORGANISM="Chrysochromulina ericina, Strain CCMP281" /NCGR_SAMPLE_ID=MMETSP1096 /ASSEMBLY_ACC=CAM_ASM_000453 /LENGTH=227 /DNA_ID=CAMNT_0023311203 /DNA_START=33 /DNA_END=716 /DNA_ORIENTATION=-